MGSGLLEPELADALSVRFWIGPAGGPGGDRATPFSTDPAWEAVASGDGWQIWQRRVPRSPAWIVRDVRFIPSPHTGRLRDWRRYAQQVRYLDGRSRDLFRSAIIDQPSERPISHKDWKTAEGIDWSGLLPFGDWVDADRDIGTMSVSRGAWDRRGYHDVDNSDRSSTLADFDAVDTTGSSRDHLLLAGDLPKPRWQFPSTNEARRDSKLKQAQPDVQPTASPTAPATTRERLQVRHTTRDQPESGPERPRRIVTAHKQPESCEVHVHEPGWVQLEVKLDEPAFIVLNQLYTPGWVARSCTWGNQQSLIPREIVRTNLMMCGVWLPSGHHRVDFRYEPAEFFWGAVLSLATLLGLLGSRCIPYCFSRRLRRPLR